jgi:phage anti-repressor protein
MSYKRPKKIKTSQSQTVGDMESLHSILENNLNYSRIIQKNKNSCYIFVQAILVDLQFDLNSENLGFV